MPHGRSMPPDGYFDDPSWKLDPVDPKEAEKRRIDHMAAHVLTRCGEWITRGRGGPKNRAFRSDVFLKCMTPQYLPTDRPTDAWVGRQHGKTRQRARDLRKEFHAYTGLPERGKRANRRSADKG